jgi:ABC-type polysaccharide/polyol phosphate export permease
LISFLVFILIALSLNFTIHFHLFPFFVSLAVLFLISLSFSVILAMMNIFFRDIKLLLPYVLQLVFFSLPIFIDIQVLEEELFKKYPITETLYFLNPLSYPVLLIKQSLFDDRWDINFQRLLYSVCCGLILLVLSTYYFQKKEQDIVEYF